MTENNLDYFKPMSEIKMEYCNIFLFLLIAGFCEVHGTESILGNLNIMGGNTTDIKSTPYQISLSISDEFACSGAILNRYWVVTVASCIEGINIKDIKIRAGSADRNQGGQLYALKKIIIHGHFNGSIDNSNDIALMKLKKSLKFSKTLKSIRLPENSAEIQEKLFVSGWGKEKDGSEGHLKKLEVQLIETRKCQKMYNHEVITSSMLCTKNSLLEGPCWDDFGDPLENVANALVGLFSWSRGKCGENPSVYTNIYHFKSWIRKHIR